MYRSLATMLVLLAATVSLPTEAHAASSQPTRVAAAKGTILYQAAFEKNGLKGWVTRQWVAGGWIPEPTTVMSGSDWTADRRGIVTFHGRLGDLFAPYQTGNVRDFAVQAKIKAGGKSGDPLEGGYGLVIADSSRRPHVVLGGILCCGTSGGPAPLLAWHDAEILGRGRGAASLHPGDNAFQLEVHGTDYTLSINGQQIVRFKISDVTNGTTVGIWGSGQELKISSFTVTRLQAMRPLPAPPPVQALDLNPADVGADRTDIPSSLMSLPGQYFTKEAVSRLRHVPIASLAAQGFLIEYERKYGCCTGLVDISTVSGPFDLDGIVDAFTSSHGAQQALTSEWAAEQKRWSGKSKYAAGDIGGVGDEAYGLSYDSQQGTIVEALFRRGAYVVQVRGIYLQGSAPRAELLTRTVALARIVDGHILQADSRCC